MIPHPRPYKLHLIKDEGDINIKNQVKVCTSPIKYNKKTIHDGLTNKITFTHKHQKFVLHPLTPNQVLEDEVQMKQKSIKRGNKEHENNCVLRVMYLCPTSNQTYIHLCRNRGHDGYGEQK